MAGQRGVLDCAGEALAVGVVVSFAYIPPRKISSANIQAEFYRRALANGWECYLEHRHQGCRFDAIIVKDGLVRFIIEAKKPRLRPRKVPKKLKQIERYEEFGVPVLLVATMSDLEAAISFIQEGIK